MDAVEDLNDDDLVCLYREGDADAFDVLFDRHHGSVYNYARTMLGDVQAAEEIMQDTFLAVARTARAYTPRGRFRPWLMRIVRNRCLNRIEAERNRRAAVAAAGLEMSRTTPRGRDDPADQAAMGERMVLLRQAIEQLPPNLREAMVLFAYEHMTYAQIAEVLETPVNTVRTHLHRARARLEQAMDGDRKR